ncbi:L,D-transpeptidase [Methylovirgula sp. HY1]|uniref:L,D-transpeptidase n=1 Tax=Methylovirgula sp. HY1 TaxID=2822761 RepID=UPI001C5AFCAB|nr:L,D-transpeptidase [Methylovirgula sp. HY1]
MTDLTRRSLIYGSAASAAALGLAGCTSTSPNSPPTAAVPQYPKDLSPPADQAMSENMSVGPLPHERYVAMYGPVTGDRFPIPAVKLSIIKPPFLRQVVDYETDQGPGTIIVDPAHHFLYHVLGAGKAMRYGVGVGRAGFAWAGDAVIKNKQEWPDRYPPKEMIERQPELKKQLAQLQSGLGMAGGPRNPLGVRAMYLWQGNKDTLYRIHGTTEPWSIGKSVSSGCIRMINQDVIDLYGRTPAGTKVIVRSTPGAARVG